MTYKTLVCLFVLLIITIGQAQSDKLHIKTDGLIETNYLQADDFYLTHYLYVDLFLRESLFIDATTEDVSAVLEAIKKYVSPNQSLGIEVEKPGDRNYLIKMVIFQKKEGDPELLIAFTNWTVDKRKFEKEIKIEHDSYTRWYFLNGAKMTYRKDMSTEQDYNNLSGPALASAYLLDEMDENDANIKPILEETLEKEALDLKDQVWAHFILLKYYLFKGNMIKYKHK